MERGQIPSTMPYKRRSRAREQQVAARRLRGALVEFVHVQGGRDELRYQLVDGNVLVGEIRYRREPGRDLVYLDESR